MKTGISSYSFERLKREGKTDIFGIIEHVKQTGFDAIEFSGLYEQDYDKKLKLAKQVKDACDAAGLYIANYSTGADLIKGSNGDLVAETDRVKKEIDVAAVLGVDKMRHDASFGFGAGDPKSRELDFYLEKIAAGCTILTEYAEKANIRTMIENHGKYCQHSQDVLKIFRAVNNDNFGLLVDIGNFLCVDQDVIQAVTDLIPFAFHVHIKDFHFKPGYMMNPGKGWFLTRGGNYLRGSVLGHGEVPLFQCVNILRANGYDKVLSIEFEGIEDNLFAIQSGYEYLCKLIA